MIIGPRSRVRPSEGGRFFGLAFCLCAVPFLREVFFFAVDRFFVVLRLPAAFLRATLFATRFAVFLAPRFAVLTIFLRTADFFAARFFARVMEKFFRMALKEFYPAEEHHQNFVALHPTQGYVMQCSLPKVQKVRATFADWLKKEK